MATDDIGAGACAAGVTYAGFGEPATATAPGGKLFPDPYTGASQTGMRIDPATRSYVFDAYGRAQGVGTVPQMVHLALTTEFGSSAVPGFGDTTSEIEVIGPNFERDVQDRVARALSDLVARKLVKVESVKVDRFGASGAYRHIRWRDLTTQEEHVST